MSITRTKNRLALLSLAVSVGLVAIKFYAYHLTGSQAVLTDALESIINVFTSGFALYSIYLSGLPKDENHPYGHGKIEYLSIGFEGALILFAGVYIFYSAIIAFLHPHAVGQLDSGMILLGLTALINLAVGFVLVRSGKRLNSVALVGDGQHLYLDALSTVASCVALVLVLVTGNVLFDAGASLVLGAFIVVNGFRMVRRSVSGLMDESDVATVEQVIAELQRQRRPAWIDVHNLRVLRYGANLHIDCHMQMPYYFSLEETHNELNAIEGLIKNRFDVEVEMFVHADPCTFAACSLCQLPDCPVRQHAFNHEVPWTVANAVKNERHRLPPG
ncbi:cation diffusion facilitator family transporter [Hymenobacter daecheongensis DSM 21074]|uniref:Cation diffusion facilitator family transporter n=1 Tax=Hymenobacter daecheongensis DSM 21074 TaxID=1121955 RepID=A0A1M6LJ64_9BACT|nr:cation diffusion facilitator family transporter [Hymenobacter daecheongensis]SHJ71202.1 cation diffusion facilitator family transporter [Hymenobacter daecheongensis DSM 21074]